LGSRVWKVQKDQKVTLEALETWVQWDLEDSQGQKADEAKGEEMAMMEKEEPQACRE